MKFNLNDCIKVQLTDLGRQIHKAHHYDTFNTEFIRKKYPYTPPKEDADGWSRWQVWNFMQIFGPHFRLGMNMPVSSEIEIIETMTADQPPCADREAIARALWLAHEDEHTLDDALAGQSKDDDNACLHKSSLEYIYELADAAISAITTQPAAELAKLRKMYEAACGSADRYKADFHAALERNDKLTAEVRNAALQEAADATMIENERCLNLASIRIPAMASEIRDAILALMTKPGER